MRMWMVDVKILCRQHLIGEYREMFTFIGTLRLKKRMDGYINNNLFEPLSIQKRFNDLKNEMIVRGYRPVKDFNYNDDLIEYLGEFKTIKVDGDKSLNDLLCRCNECKKRYIEGVNQC